MKSSATRRWSAFLHHTPVEAMSAPILVKDGIKRSWRLTCALERISPKKTGSIAAYFCNGRVC
ncbi:MAG: hypothetical protein K9L79_14015 [Methylobacter tundripaludum]|jgi:hypothetical protein|nr:hypothetical protein [Methylobacter tundripaludum]